MVAPVGSIRASDFAQKRRFSRRDFLKVTAVLGLDAFILGIVGVGYMSNVEPSWVEVSRVRLKLPRLPDAFSGLRIAQLSDIHIGPWMTLEKVREILSAVVEQSPDVLALTGDFVLTYSRMGKSYRAELEELSQAIRQLSDRFLVVAVLGNHDVMYNSFEVQDALQKGGAHVLVNSVHTLERGAARFHLAGLDDIYRGRPDLNKVLDSFPSDECAMLLVHEPDFADTSAETGRFDLQISGHSHGGQIVLPFVGPPILPKYGQKYPSGLYQVSTGSTYQGGKMFQYTNRGVGMTFPAVRFNCRPEITLFTLESV